MKNNKKEKKILKYIKEHKVIISVLSLILVLIITGTTLAIFLTSGEGTEKSYTLGNVDVEYTEGNIIKAENAIPLADYEIEEYATKKEFSFRNTGNIPMYAEILLTEIEISDNLKNNNFVWELYEKDNNEYSEISNGNFAEIKDGKTISLKKGIRVEVGADPTNYKLLVYIKDNGLDQNDMEKSNMSAKVTIIATDKSIEYVDDSGANPPKLAEGMIPVIYDEDSDEWVKADLRKEWYDYDEQMWANAVTVYPEHRETYVNAKPGTSISMYDINTMWVWVPRYKYRIPDSIGIGTTLTPITNSPMIDVVFEAGVSSTGVSETEYRNAIKSDGTVAANIYYTHPAFRDGSKVYNNNPYDIGGWDHELTGIWVAKFELSNNYKVIKPNMSISFTDDVFRSFKVSIEFAGGTFDETTGNIAYTGNSYYGLNKTVNTHMIKNTEWGAVAYLSQSKYGKMGNNNYSGYDEVSKTSDRLVYINNSLYSGRSIGSYSNSYYSSDYGTYSYNGYTCIDAKCISGEKNENTVLEGTGASTTGTIYGIYDLVGGANEHVMSSWENIPGTYFKVLPSELKYYDLYTTDKGILGDATWETAFWNNTSSSFSKTTGFLRGGEFGLIYQKAMMRFESGGRWSTSSVHTVLIP